MSSIFSQNYQLLDKRSIIFLRNTIKDTMDSTIIAVAYAHCFYRAIYLCLLNCGSPLSYARLDHCPYQSEQATYLLHNVEALRSNHRRRARGAIGGDSPLNISEKNGYSGKKSFFSDK